MAEINEFVNVVLDPGAKMPTQANPSDSGFDLYTLEDCVVTGRPQIIKTGVHLVMPPGLAAQVVSRSSTALRLRVGVCTGTLDQAYTGDVGIVAYVINWAGRGHNVTLPAGSRIAQVVFSRPSHPRLLRVSELPDTQRGSNGFGSSGK